MDLKKCYLLEDLFPKSFADYEERSYGILFYNITNKDSYDSNHAVIFRDKINNLSETLKDIISFYHERGINPTIYQSTQDSGYFGEIKEELCKAGFDSWLEEQRFMVLKEENTIVPNEKLVVKKTEKWDDSLVQIFLEAEEPWEIEVVKRALCNPNTVLWVVYLEEKPIGFLYCLMDGDICRGNYVLVSKQHRNVGAGRTLTYHYVRWCKENGIRIVFHWPDGEHPEKIYYDAGFRYVETVHAGRASYRNNERLHNILKNKKVIFFDVGYTLDYPASGDWMFTKKFYEVLGDKLNGIDSDIVSKARDYALTYLENNHLVNGIEEEYKQFHRFYSDIVKYLGIEVSAEDIDAIAKDRVTNMNNYVVYEDALCVVKELSQTHKLGIISDTWPSIDNQLKAIGVYDYFSTFTYSCDLGVFKPNEKMYLDALQKCGCKPEETVFIDDSVRNLEGAETLGITPILIAANSAADVETKYYKIHSLSELLQ